MFLVDLSHTYFLLLSPRSLSFLLRVPCLPLVSDDLGMNAVMRLNQYKPGLEYRLLSQAGPVHEPVFTMAVDLDGKTYESTGPSKRAAKLNVATKASLFHAVSAELVVRL